MIQPCNSIGLSAILAKTRSIRMSCWEVTKANHLGVFWFYVQRKQLIFTWKFTSHIIWTLATCSKILKSVSQPSHMAWSPQSRHWWCSHHPRSYLWRLVAGHSPISMVGEHMTPVVGGLVLQNHPRVGGFMNLNLVNSMFHIFMKTGSDMTWHQFDRRRPLQGSIFAHLRKLPIFNCHNMFENVGKSKGDV